MALLDQGAPVLSIWMIATVGNTMGSAINWLLGAYALNYRNHKWFPVKEAPRLRAEHWFNRFGKWSLLFAWLPIVGDALTLIAGTLRVNFLVFTTLTAIGKGGRYAFLAFVYFQFF